MRYIRTEPILERVDAYTRSTGRVDAHLRPKWNKRKVWYWTDRGYVCKIITEKWLNRMQKESTE